MAAARLLPARATQLALRHTGQRRAQHQATAQQRLRHTFLAIQRTCLARIALQMQAAASHLVCQ